MKKLDLDLSRNLTIKLFNESTYLELSRFTVEFKLDGTVVDKSIDLDIDTDQESKEITNRVILYVNEFISNILKKGFMFEKEKFALIIPEERIILDINEVMCDYSVSGELETIRIYSEIEW